VKIKPLKSVTDAFDLHFPEDKPFDVVGFGTSSIDHLCVVREYPSIDSKSEILHYARLPGGQVATAVLFLSRMGLKTSYIGKLGGDDLGREALCSFDAESVDTSGVLIEPNAGSQVAVIIIDQSSGERTVLSRRGNDLNFRELELQEDRICSGRILHLDGYDFEASLAAAGWCQKHNIPVSIDLDTAFPQCLELIHKVDFLIVSKNFPVEFTGISDPLKAFKELRNYHDGFHAMTLGAEGAVTWVDNRCIHFPALKAESVDTTGAGDIFHGGFIYGLLQNWSIQQIMSFANAAAGLSCGYLGARTGIRPLQEIMRYSERLWEQPHQ
jgi:sulfofructose kinase